MARRWLILLVALALAAGCASVPDSGPAVPVAVPGPSETSVAEDNDVNSDLPVPQPEADISLGAYVTAMNSTHNPGLLGDFVATAARASYTQNPQVVAVRGLRYRIGAVVNNTTSALFTGQLMGALDSDGEYDDAGGRAWQQQVPMVKQGGAWLFADAPPLVINEARFANDFEENEVYFAAAPSSVTGTDPKLVIPEPRYVNNDLTQSTPTQVVDFILAGPSEGLSRVAQNPLPKIRRSGRVTISNGDLVIELEPEAESASAEKLNAFVAEVGWSLLDRFSGRIRLLVGGRPLDVPHFVSSQTKAMWQQYNPATVADALHPFVVQKGAVKELVPQSPAPELPRLTPPVVAKDVQAAAVSLSLTQLATVRPDPAGGQRLWVADSSGTLQPTLRANGIGRPSWGGGSSTVLVPVAGRVFQVGVGNAKSPTEVEVFGEGRRITDVTSVRLSLDGVRALVVAGSGSSARLYFGTIAGTEAGSALVMTTRRLAVQGVPRDVAWWGPVTAAVAVTVPDRHEVSIDYVPIDGAPDYVQSTQYPESDSIRIAADPTTNNEAGTIALQVGERVYNVTFHAQLPSRSVVGGSPFYPG